MARHLPVRAAVLLLILASGACKINNALAPESHITSNNGTSASPALANPDATSTGGAIEGSGNGQNAPGTSMPSGPGLKGGQLDKDNAAVVTKPAS